MLRASLESVGGCMYRCGLNPIPVSGSRTGVVGSRKTYSSLPHYPLP